MHRGELCQWSHFYHLKPQGTASGSIWGSRGPLAAGHSRDLHPFSSVCWLWTYTAQGIQPPLSTPPSTPRFPRAAPAERALGVTQSSWCHLAEPSSTRRCVTAPSHQSWEQQEEEAKGSPHLTQHPAAPHLLSDLFPCCQSSLALEFIFPPFPARPGRRN